MSRVAQAACLALLTVAAYAETGVNFTTYRVTPITYPGLDNMDSGNAAGDVFFGMSQLLLPQLCADDSEFLWCENRAYLSGGSAWMVYSGFVVVTRDLYGEYEACNPCQGREGEPTHGDIVQCPPGVPNGTFVCASYGDEGPTPPPQCDGGYEIWHEDCLNGTVYKTLTGLDPKEAEGKCCEACSADNTTCAGWNMPDGDNGTTCQLMKEPLQMWSNGQQLSSCKAAVVDHSVYKCWYSNPDYAGFAPYCNKSQCLCDVIEQHKAVGREEEAMCHDESVSTSLKTNTPHATPPYWSCSDAMSDYCFNGYMPSPTCSACAVEHWKDLESSGCTKDMIPHLCGADFEGCYKEVEAVCGKSIGTSSCTSCVTDNTAKLEMANCTSLFANYACRGGHSHNKWESYIDTLACHMKGNWYSTTSAGECPTKELTKDCWWYIDHEIRTVNASCVDGKVIATVQAKRPECWAACPEDERTNITSACYLDCVFETILGNSTTGVPAMAPSELTTAFENAFTQPVSNGGCEAVHRPDDETLVALGLDQENVWLTDEE